MPGGVSTLETLTERPEPVLAARPRALAYALGALFVGTVVAVDPGGLVPTGPLRWTVIAVCSGVAIIALLLRPLRVERLTAMLWGALVAWLLVASLFASDRLYAWIGTPDRRLGFVAWIIFPLLFFCGQSMTTPVDRRVVLRAAAIGAALLGGWCVAERFGWSVIDASFAHHRIGGSFGQPAYLGAAAVLLGPLAALVMADGTETRLMRAVAAVGTVTMVFALVASQTRGAWIGVVVACIAVARGRWRWIAMGAAVIVVVFAVTVGDRGDGTTGGRLAEWRVATRVVAHDPVLGAGPEGYRIEFPGAVDAGYVREYGVAVEPDRAHNAILDTAAIGGVPAALLYGALLVILVLRAARLRNAMAFAVIAYVVQQLFLFPLSEIDPLFWVIAGMLVASHPGGASVLRQYDALATLRRVGSGFVIAATVVAVVMGAREVGADRHLDTAARQSNLAAADAATRLRPDSIRTWFVASRVAARGEAITSLDAAITRIDSGLDVSPRDPALRAEMARLLVDRAARSELPPDLDRATRTVDAFLRDAPNDPRLWLARGRAALVGRDRAAARRALARAADLAPGDQVIRELQAQAEKS